MLGPHPAAAWTPVTTVSIHPHTTVDCRTHRRDDVLSSVVNNNASAFREAYWEVNSLFVYTPPSVLSAGGSYVLIAIIPGRPHRPPSMAQPRGRSISPTPGKVML